LLARGANAGVRDPASPHTHTSKLVGSVRCALPCKLPTPAFPAHAGRLMRTSGAVEQLERRILGEDAEPLILKSWQDGAAAALALVSQAKRSIHILSYDLDPQLYDNEPFVAALKEFCLRSGYAEARLLLRDATYAIKHGHRVIGLSRRLTSCIQIRKPLAETREVEGSFLVADGLAVLSRKLAADPAGTVDFRTLGEARRLLELFADLWERSAPDPELRRLHI
jgi:hypothetical protein